MTKKAEFKTSDDFNLAYFVAGFCFASGIPEPEIQNFYMKIRAEEKIGKWTWLTIAERLAEMVKEFKQ